MRVLLLIFLIFVPTAAIAGQGDVALYHDVADEVTNGADYYDTVAKLHRERGYPLTPVVTVRSPALAYVAATIGKTGLFIAAWALAFLGLAAWYIKLKDNSLSERATFMGLLAAGSGAFISESSIYTHEMFAGLLVTLALGLSWDRRLQVVAATLAVLFRELAAPILFLILYPFETQQTKRVATAMALVFGYYCWHFMKVSAVVRPSDLPSPGWFGSRGPSGLTDHLSTLVNFEFSPWFAFMPLVGWLMYRDRVPFVWCLGVVFAVCVIAREDNLFWFLMSVPVYFAGLAFLLKPLSAIGTKLVASRADDNR
jgi:hypothetical protein